MAACPAGTTLFVPGQSNVCVDNFVIRYFPLYPLGTPNAGPGDSEIFTFNSKRVVDENFVFENLTILGNLP